MIKPVMHTDGDRPGDSDTPSSTIDSAALPATNDDPRLPDLIAHQLDVLFCGINPGLTAAVSGHHFVQRSNRFWRVLHLAGFSPEQIAPQNDHHILRYGCGLTTVVARATTSADQLAVHEFIAAGAGFKHKVARYAPRTVAFLGKAAYSALAGQSKLDWGLQSARLEGAMIWVLPNPSGRNRAFDLDRLVAAYRQLYRHTKATRPPPRPILR